MQTFRFTQIYKDNHDLYQDLLPLWIDYINEIDVHKCVFQSNDEIIQNLNRRVKIQGTRKEMHFELFYCDDVPIGFANFAIDTGTLYGLLEAGYGVVMEFYVAPVCRRKGYGKLLYEHVENTLKGDGARYMCLTPDLVTGVLFWVAMGFNDTGKIDPDNQLPIYLKQLIVL